MAGFRREVTASNDIGYRYDGCESLMLSRRSGHNVHSGNVVRITKGSEPLNIGQWDIEPPELLRQLKYAADLGNSEAWGRLAY